MGEKIKVMFGLTKENCKKIWKQEKSKKIYKFFLLFFIIYKKFKRKNNDFIVLFLFLQLYIYIYDGDKEMGSISHSPSPKEWWAPCNTQAPSYQPKAKVRLAGPET